MTRSTIQTLYQVTKAYHSKNLVYHLGTFAANKVNFTWFVTLILGLDASTFRLVNGACSVIPFECACTLKRGAPLTGVFGIARHSLNGPNSLVGPCSSTRKKWTALKSTFYVGFPENNLAQRPIKAYLVVSIKINC